MTDFFDLTPFERFLAEVEEMCAVINGPTLGERLLHHGPFSRTDTSGIVLATWCAVLKDRDRESNFSGMITRLKSYRENGESWVLVEYHDDKGPHQHTFLLSNFIRLIPFPRELNGYRFSINEAGILIKEDMSKDETFEPQEGTDVTSPTAVPNVA